MREMQRWDDKLRGLPWPLELFMPQEWPPQNQGKKLAVKKKKKTGLDTELKSSMLLKKKLMGEGINCNGSQI